MPVTDVIPTEALLRYLQATPEQRAAIDRFLLGAADALGNGARRSGQVGRERYVFELMGNAWRLVNEEGEAHYPAGTLGPLLLRHLLYHPNEPIAALDLELEVRPELGRVRDRTSRQAESDPAATREYLRRLTALRASREVAAEEGQEVEAEALAEEIAALEAGIEAGDIGADSGERARDRVRKALGAMVRRLKKGNAAARSLARLIEERIQVGHRVLYNEPMGRIWG
jgi:hypothetical protein